MEYGSNAVNEGGQLFHPGFSVDCVVFGFHANKLKILLLKMKHAENWALPGGFVRKDEDVDNAVVRVLQSRTGLEDIFLHQFHLFGEVNRNDQELNKRFLEQAGHSYNGSHWFLQRFITVGYYALVEYSRVNPEPDYLSEACTWHDIHKIPALIHDHREILNKAIETLRSHLNQHPIGYTLLPEKFTMPELQKLYETILDKALDRRNFQRKMLGYGILKKLNEQRTGGAHKSPTLYKFDLRNYKKALKEGLKGSW
jgi:ADP-ribose pyrophosphatase YjhB (NUDIX family)